MSIIRNYRIGQSHVGKFAGKYDFIDSRKIPNLFFWLSTKDKNVD